MRFSMDKADPGYEPYLAIIAKGKQATVFLDGIEQNKCLTVDDVSGVVIRYCEDQSMARDRFLTETVTGAVKIELHDAREHSQ
jgi:hypothetical protein